MEVVFTRWEEVVGAELAAHVRPQRVDGRVLVVVVEHPAWATRARMESGQIVARLRTWGERRSTAWKSWSSALTGTSGLRRATVQKCRNEAAVG